MSIPLLLMAFLLTSASSIAQYGTVIIKIKNIQTLEGNLVIGIFDKKENFPIDGLQFKKTTLKVDANEMTYSVELPSQKEYALAIFHDRNADGFIDRNWFGIPLEPYGFSNNIRPTLSAPEFEKVKFRLDKSANLDINLK